jgi:hypothetical protein
MSDVQAGKRRLFIAEGKGVQPRDPFHVG